MASARCSTACVAAEHRDTGTVVGHHVRAIARIVSAIIPRNIRAKRKYATARASEAPALVTRSPMFGK